MGEHTAEIDKLRVALKELQQAFSQLGFDLRKEIHDTNIAFTQALSAKQNKVPLPVIVTLLLAVVLNGAGVIAVSSGALARLELLSKQMELVTDDRFKGKDAKAMQRDIRVEIQVLRNDIQRDMSSKFNRIWDRVHALSNDLSDARKEAAGGRL